MNIELDLSNPQHARILGYWWALTQPDDDYTDQDYEPFWYRQGGTEKLFPEFELGVWDTHEQPDDLLSVTEVANAANVTRKYILNEIRDKRLKAIKVGKQYMIVRHHFSEWMMNPRRGSRSEK